MYGDFQYMTDSTSPDFLRKGVSSCYLPVDSNEKESQSQHRELQIEDWKKLYRLAFTDKGGAYEDIRNIISVPTISFIGRIPTSFPCTWAITISD
jgi:hypothetical protein